MYWKCRLGLSTYCGGRPWWKLFILNSVSGMDTSSLWLLPSRHFATYLEFSYIFFWNFERSHFLCICRICVSAIWQISQNIAHRRSFWEENPKLWFFCVSASVSAAYLPYLPMFFAQKIAYSHPESTPCVSPNTTKITTHVEIPLPPFTRNSTPIRERRSVRFYQKPADAPNMPNVYFLQKNTTTPPLRVSAEQQTLETILRIIYSFTRHI